MDATQVKQLRSIMGLKQQELADLLGVSRQTISNYEKGKVIPLTTLGLLEEIKRKHKNPNEQTQRKGAKVIPLNGAEKLIIDEVTKGLGAYIARLEATQLHLIEGIAKMQCELEALHLLFKVDNDLMEEEPHIKKKK